MKNKNFILKLYLVYNSFDAFFLITGPFLSDLGVSIVAILFLVNTKINNLSKYYNNIYFKLFFIFGLS